MNISLMKIGVCINTFFLLTFSVNAFSLECIKLSNTDTQSSYIFLQTLCPIFVDSFEKGAEAQLKQEHPEAYEALTSAGKTIRDILPARFNKIIETMLNQIDTVDGSYVSLIKNDSAIIVGYAFITHAPINNVLQSMINRQYIVSIIALQEPHINIKKPADDAYILSVGVSPHHQGFGLGKQLVFSIFTECPNVKHIYLMTTASQTNHTIQSFYEHIGFTPKGRFITSDNNEKIFYGFDIGNMNKANTDLLQFNIDSLYEKTNMQDLIQEIIRITGKNVK